MKTIIKYKLVFIVVIVLLVLAGIAMAQPEKNYYDVRSTLSMFDESNGLARIEFVWENDPEFFFDTETAFRVEDSLWLQGYIFDADSVEVAASLENKYVIVWLQYVERITELPSK